MTRICKLASCTNPVSGPRAEFCKPAHRAAYWRTQHVVAVVQEPGPRSGANARSGRQISFEKAVAVVSVDLWYRQAYPTYEECRTQAERVLMAALPERQQGWRP